MSEVQPIEVGEKGRQQLRELIDAIERAEGQANTYLAGLMAGLDVPDGWQFDPQAMAFVPPPALAGAGPNGAE